MIRFVQCLQLLVLGIVACLSAVHAQTPTPTSTPPTLEDLEATYHKTLLKAQMPLLLQYQNELQDLLDKSPEADRDAVRFELARISTLINDGTPIDLTARKSEATDAEAKSGKRRGIVFTLDPEETKPPLAKNSTIALGTAIWPFSKLPAGKYELVGLMSCPAPLPALPTIIVSFHGSTSTVELTSRNITKNEGAFRQLVLGTLTLTEEVRNEELTVTAAGDAPWIFTKQLRLVKARE